MTTVAVIGVGTTRYGSFPELDEYGLAAWAFREALGECGVEKKLIDGLLVCRIPYYARMGEVLGLDPRWTLTLPAHGRMSGIGIIEAATALCCRALHLCGAALCEYRAVAAGELWRRRKSGGLGSLGVHVAGGGACADVSPAYGTVWDDDTAACRGVGRHPVSRDAEP